MTESIIHAPPPAQNGAGARGSARSERGAGGGGYGVMIVTPRLPMKMCAGWQAGRPGDREMYGVPEVGGSICVYDGKEHRSAKLRTRSTAC